MAGRFIQPYPQFLDSTPNVYSGGKLYFYAAGTSTPLDTYTTKALAVANPNPVVLNSAGRPAVDIFLQDLEYKVVLKDSADSTIWTADPVSHRDSGLIAKTMTGSGSPNGTTAGTAGSSSILPDFYWDYTNSILYVCTTTGTTSTAVWTAVNASSAAAAVPLPQGRLTMTSATPVLTAGVTAGTALYYTQHSGNLVPIYNGTTMVPTEFNELTLTLSSSHIASNIYDVYVFSNSGVPTLVTGPSWSAGTSGSIAAGSCARGTGAGGAALARVKGLYTNAVSMTARNGSTTYTVGANLGTFIGSIFMDGTNGQLTCHTAYGQSRKWGVWNAYNRVPIQLLAGDATASWTTAPTTWRQSRADATNFAVGFCGLAEESISAEFAQSVTQSYAGTGLTANIGVGVNSTTVLSGKQGYAVASMGADIGTGGGTMEAKHTLLPALGINNFNMIEQAPTGTTGNLFVGSSVSMVMTLKWLG